MVIGKREEDLPDCLALEQKMRQRVGGRVSQGLSTLGIKAQQREGSVLPVRLRSFLIDLLLSSL